MIENLCNLEELKIGHHTFKTLELQDNKVDDLKKLLVSELPETYLSKSSFEETMKSLGESVAFKKLKLKFPTKKNIRSGDVGEVMARTYIEKHLDYRVPIKKLQWRDHRDMAMRGDDVIAISIDGNNIKFIKCEAKSVQKLSNAILNEARKELDQYEGKPSIHTLDFIIERLKSMGDKEKELAFKLEKHIYNEQIKLQDVSHLLFVFTKSNPNLLQKTAFEAYKGNICQISIGLKIKEHQNFIRSVFVSLDEPYE